jgi:hypothetical protein
LSRTFDRDQFLTLNTASGPFIKRNFQTKYQPLPNSLVVIPMHRLCLQDLIAPYLSYLTQKPEDAGEGGEYIVFHYTCSIYILYTQHLHLCPSLLVTQSLLDQSVNHMQIPCCYFP